MDKERAGIQSVEVGFALLEALTRARGPQMLKDLASDAGMSAAKAHRYLVSFQRIGLVTQDARTSRYDLGPARSSWAWPRWRGWTPCGWRASACPN
jgi:DNA-binding IclR family transcriptional regulator